MVLGVAFDHVERVLPSMKKWGPLEVTAVISKKVVKAICLIAQDFSNPNNLPATRAWQKMDLNTPMVCVNTLLPLPCFSIMRYTPPPFVLTGFFPGLAEDWAADHNYSSPGWCVFMCPAKSQGFILLSNLLVPAALWELSPSFYRPWNWSPKDWHSQWVAELVLKQKFSLKHQPNTVTNAGRHLSVSFHFKWWWRWWWWLWRWWWWW
jgi:hypothetical protein